MSNEVCGVGRIEFGSVDSYAGNSDL